MDTIDPSIASENHFADVNARDTGCLEAAHANWLIRLSAKEETLLKEDKLGELFVFNSKVGSTQIAFGKGQRQYVSLLWAQYSRCCNCVYLRAQQQLSDQSSYNWQVSETV